MIKLGIFLAVLVFGTTVGYFIGQTEKILQPNYRWVQIFNKTDCALKSVSVLFPDRSVTASSEQFESSVFPGPSEAEANLPVLASEDQEYRMKLEFERCQTRLTENQSFSSGTYIQVWVYEDEVHYSYR